MEHLPQVLPILPPAVGVERIGGDGAHQHADSWFQTGREDLVCASGVGLGGHDDQRPNGPAREESRHRLHLCLGIVGSLSKGMDGLFGDAQGFQQFEGDLLRVRVADAQAKQILLPAGARRVGEEDLGGEALVIDPRRLGDAKEGLAGEDHDQIGLGERVRGDQVMAQGAQQIRAAQIEAGAQEQQHQQQADESPG